MKSYQKIFGIFRNPAVRREIDTLDATNDHQRIVHLLLCYEFSFDMVRANELALFHTYASPSISKLLDKTGEFAKNGQKRYDDTRILITEFVQNGYDSDFGRRAIDQMNKIHGNFRIPNEDFLFVLSTFVFYPIDWMDKYGWRKLSQKEQQALFLFFMEIGKRMMLQNVPKTLEDLQHFVTDYEDRNLVFAQSNQNVANATIRIFQGWFPKFLHPIVPPAAAALISQKLRTAFGFKKPSAIFCGFLNVILQIRKIFLRPITFMKYPNLIENIHFQTYPKQAIEIEKIAPKGLRVY